MPLVTGAVVFYVRERILALANRLRPPARTDLWNGSGCLGHAFGAALRSWARASRMASEAHCCCWRLGRWICYGAGERERGGVGQSTRAGPAGGRDRSGLFLRDGGLGSATT